MASRTRAKGTTTQRGYGAQHQALRAKWKPLVEAGQVRCHATHCLMQSRWIQPGTLWDLGHTPDRRGWTGPEHRRCNRADGAVRGNKRRARPLRWVL